MATEVIGTDSEVVTCRQRIITMVHGSCWKTICDKLQDHAKHFYQPWMCFRHRCTLTIAGSFWAGYCMQYTDRSSSWDTIRPHTDDQTPKAHSCPFECGIADPHLFGPTVGQCRMSHNQAQILP